MRRSPRAAFKPATLVSENLTPVRHNNEHAPIADGERFFVGNRPVRHRAGGRVEMISSAKAPVPRKAKQRQA
jgi:hypothetical protein